MALNAMIDAGNFFLESKRVWESAGRDEWHHASVNLALSIDRHNTAIRNFNKAYRHKDVTIGC